MFNRLVSLTKLDYLEKEYLKNADTFNKNDILKIFTNANYKKLDSEI